MQMHLEGERGSVSTRLADSRDSDSGVHNSGMKRSRGYQGDSLAALSRDVADEEMFDEHAEAGRRVRGRYDHVPAPIVSWASG